MDELDLWSQFRSQFHYAWVIALGLVLGGLIGYLVHKIEPPIYEAVAVMSVNLDTTQTNGIELTEYDKDQLLGTTGTTLISGKVTQVVLDQLKDTGIHLSYTSLLNSCSIERRQNEWHLKCRSTNPQTAQTIANIWLQAAYEAMITQQDEGQIVKYMIIMPPNTATLPGTPIAYERKKLMFAGLTLGFVAGILVNLRLANRKKNPLKTFNA